VKSLFVEIARDESFTPRQRSELLGGIYAEATDPGERAALEQLIEEVRDLIDDTEDDE
jgi:hypothetical protein